MGGQRRAVVTLVVDLVEVRPVRAVSRLGGLRQPPCHAFVGKPAKVLHRLGYFFTRTAPRSELGKLFGQTHAGKRGIGRVPDGRRSADVGKVHELFKGGASLGGDFVAEARGVAARRSGGDDGVSGPSRPR